MKHFLSHLPLQVRAICILLTLFMVPNIVHADDVYLLTAETINGTTGNYNVPSNHQFTNTSGTVYTYTINTIPTGGTFSFRIGVDGWKDNMQPYTDGYALAINGSSYTISENCYGKTKAWKVSYTDGEYSSLTITVDLSSSNRYVKITGVKSISGGAAPLTPTSRDSISMVPTSVLPTPTNTLLISFCARTTASTILPFMPATCRFPCSSIRMVGMSTSHPPAMALPSTSHT